MLALLHHTALTLRLNFRSRQAMIYGYLVPALFLFAFATVYRSELPRLSREMGQVLTIGVLGGACFGMPTAMVAERERGVWRRYQLLPAATAGLVVSTMLARFVLLASSAAVQVGLAWLAYRTPVPARPAALCGAFAVVAFAFEGMGLVIAALADSVPAVQALGQAVFLPVILVGGVGVPLSALPHGARVVAGYLPGRYAVELMQPCFTRVADPAVAFPVAALLVIGAAGCVAGGRMFRWDPQLRPAPGSRAWAAVAAAAWVGVGTAAVAAGRAAPADLPPAPATVPTTVPATAPQPTPTTAAVTAPKPWDAVTDAQVNGIGYQGLPADDDKVTPLAASATDFPGDDDEDRQRMTRLVADLDRWPALAGADGGGGRVRLLLSFAAVADLVQDPLEGNVARAVFDKVRADAADDRGLARELAWVVLYPDDGAVVTTAPELGVAGTANEGAVRERTSKYAQKLLGRVLGKLPDVTPNAP